MGAFARGSSIATSLDVFSFRLGRRWTTVRLEPGLIAALQRIALALGCSVSELATEIAIARGEGSLTSAFRTFIVHYYENRAGLSDPCIRKGTGRHGAIARLAASVKRDDWVERTPLDVTARDAAASLASYCRFWEMKTRGDGSVLSNMAIDPDIIDRCGLRGYVHTIDASVADPHNYRFRNYGASVRLARPRNLAGTRIGDFPVRAFRDAVAEDYHAAVASGRPRLHRIRALISGSDYAYQRLLLPVSTARGRPGMLVVAISVEQAAAAP